MQRYLMRATLLVYVGYIALLITFASNPTTDTASRGLIVFALALIILWLAKGGTAPSYETYQW